MHINSVRKNNGMNNREILFMKKETEEKCHQHTHTRTNTKITSGFSSIINGWIKIMIIILRNKYSLT